jgi:hypothetical protein
MSSIDESLARWNAAWQSVARYSVYLSLQGGKRGEVLATGLDYAAARELEERTNKRLEAEQIAARGSSSAWSRPLAHLELENQAEALEAVRRRDLDAGAAPGAS